MGYIIVWRNRHREPHINTDTHDFKEEFSSYEAAKKSADDTIDREGPKSPWYFDYAIYQEVDN